MHHTIYAYLITVHTTSSFYVNVNRLPGVFQTESVGMFWNAIHIVEAVEAEVHTNRTWTWVRLVNYVIISNLSDYTEKAE